MIFDLRINLITFFYFRLTGDYLGMFLILNVVEDVEGIHRSLKTSK